MTVKNDAEFKEELTRQFKIDMTNFTIFDPEQLKITKICTLMGSVEQSIKCFS